MNDFYDLRPMYRTAGAEPMPAVLRICCLGRCPEEARRRGFV
jgi:hypothetical protein